MKKNPSPGTSSSLLPNKFNNLQSILKQSYFLFLSSGLWSSKAGRVDVHLTFQTKPFCGLVRDYLRKREKWEKKNFESFIIITTGTAKET